MPGQDKNLHQASYTVGEQLVPFQLLLCKDWYKSIAADIGFMAAPQHDIAKVILHPLQGCFTMKAGQ